MNEATKPDRSTGAKRNTASAHLSIPKQVQTRERMPTEAFVQTFTLASLGLGSAIFVLVAVIPTILPNAVDAALARLKEIRQELPGLGSLTGREVSEKLDNLKEKMDDLKDKVQSINMILRIGGVGAVVFIVAGLMSLLLLANSPSYDSFGSAYYPDAPLITAFEALFIVGLGLGGIFAGMFSNLVALLLSSKPVGELFDLISPTPAEKVEKPKPRVEQPGVEVPPADIDRYEFVLVAKETRLLTAQTPELQVRRWFAQQHRVRVSMTCTDTADCFVLFHESKREISPDSVPTGDAKVVDRRRGVREWFKEADSPSGVWLFVVRRPATNWLNGVATVQVWEGQPVFR